MQMLYITCTLLSMIWTLGDFNSVYLLTGGGPADLTHVLSTLGIRYLRLDQLSLAMASIVCALPFVLPLVYFMMKRFVAMKLAKRYAKSASRHALPADRHPSVHLDHGCRSTHMFVFAISPEGRCVLRQNSGPRIRPCTIFHIVFYQEHYFLRDFLDPVSGIRW